LNVHRDTWMTAAAAAKRRGVRVIVDKSFAVVTERVDCSGRR